MKKFRLRVCAGAEWDAVLETAWALGWVVIATGPVSAVYLGSGVATATAAQHQHRPPDHDNACFTHYRRTSHQPMKTPSARTKQGHPLRNPRIIRRLLPRLSPSVPCKASIAAEASQQDSNSHRNSLQGEREPCAASWSCNPDRLHRGCGADITWHVHSTILHPPGDPVWGTPTPPPPPLSRLGLHGPNAPPCVLTYIQLRPNHGLVLTGKYFDSECPFYF